MNQGGEYRVACIFISGEESKVLSKGGKEGESQGLILRQRTGLGELPWAQIGQFTGLW